jgi:hypothetical protein
MKLDDEWEPVVSARSDTVLVCSGDLWCGLPPVKGKPDGDPFLEGNVLDLNYTSEGLAIVIKE